jgi:hypothetical protein
MIPMTTNGAAITSQTTSTCQNGGSSTSIAAVSFLFCFLFFVFITLLLN